MSISPQVAAFVGTLDKETLDSIAREVIAKHELGCTCAFCMFARSRYPAASVDDADTFAREGGEHQEYPFGAENSIHFASIAKSLSIIASGVVSIRDIFRGRDSNEEVVQSPYRALVGFMLGRPAQTAPETQRNPGPNQQATAPAMPPTQATLFSAQKRVATDAEMQQLVGVMDKFTLKIRMDPKKWPKDSQKGKAVLARNSVTGELITEVDPEFLPFYADQLDWFAGEAAKRIAGGTGTDQDKKNAQNDPLDAARCRRVIQLVQQGSVKYVPPAPVPAFAGSSSSLI